MHKPIDNEIQPQLQTTTLPVVGAYILELYDEVKNESYSAYQIFDMVVYFNGDTHTQQDVFEHMFKFLDSNDCKMPDTSQMFTITDDDNPYGSLMVVACTEISLNHKKYILH